MKESAKIGDRIVALFLLGVLTLNAPVLSLFSAEGVVFGLPILYVYLFATWAALIVLMGLTTRRSGESGRRASRRRPTGPVRGG